MHGLSGAGKQHRAAQRGPQRHHQREQHRPELSTRHRGGFQRQHLCGGPETLAASVFVYPALGSSTGLLNEAPTATISGSNTGLVSPEGIALDSSRNIYVADDSAASVFVYPALGSSTGLLNEAPTATISGSNTGLNTPYGIALDSSGNIYVADTLAASVFVYPPLGSSTGLLNEAPTATISGSNTGLSYPEGIALDSSSNIYVADNSANSVLVYPAREQRQCRSQLRHHQHDHDHRPRMATRHRAGFQRQNLCGG